MKLTAGMGSLTDFPKLKACGADELFVGYVPLSWRKRFESVLPLNRREVLFYHVQIGSLEDMKLLRRLSENSGIRISVTFNSLTYTAEQLPLVLSYMRELSDIGFPDFIVSDCNLIRAVSASDLPVRLHLSGEFGEWNKETFRFLAEHFSKISRIIFHRKMTPEEMGTLVSCGREIGLCDEYEAFFLNEKCHYSGAFCNSFHADELPHLCHEEYRTVSLSDEQAVLPAGTEEPETGNTGCGICALYRLQNAGITHLKIVGRGASADCMAEDILRGRRALTLLSGAENEAAYLRKIEAEKEAFRCNHNCYYY